MSVLTCDANEYLVDLTRLLNGQLSPREVVGTGYRYPKQCASEWLRKQAFNSLNAQKIDQVLVSTSGRAFSSIDKAKASAIYKKLKADPNQPGMWLNDNYHVTHVDVCPEIVGGGFEIHVTGEYQRN